MIHIKYSEHDYAICGIMPDGIAEWYLPKSIIGMDERKREICEKCYIGLAMNKSYRRKCKSCSHEFQITEQDYQGECCQCDMDY